MINVDVLQEMIAGLNPKGASKLPVFSAIQRLIDQLKEKVEPTTPNEVTLWRVLWCFIDNPVPPADFTLINTVYDSWDKEYREEQGSVQRLDIASNPGIYFLFQLLLHVKSVHLLTESADGSKLRNEAYILVAQYIASNALIIKEKILVSAQDPSEEYPDDQVADNQGIQLLDMKEIFIQNQQKESLLDFIEGAIKALDKSRRGVDITSSTIKECFDVITFFLEHIFQQPQETALWSLWDFLGLQFQLAYKNKSFSEHLQANDLQRVVELFSSAYQPVNEGLYKCFSQSDRESIKRDLIERFHRAYFPNPSELLEKLTRDIFIIRCRRVIHCHQGYIGYADIYQEQKKSKMSYEKFLTTITAYEIVFKAIFGAVSGDRYDVSNNKRMMSCLIRKLCGQELQVPSTKNSQYHDIIDKIREKIISLFIEHPVQSADDSIKTQLIQAIFESIDPERRLNCFLRINETLKVVKKTFNKQMIDDTVQMIYAFSELPNILDDAISLVSKKITKQFLPNLAVSVTSHSMFVCDVPQEMVVSVSHGPANPYDP